MTSRTVASPSGSMRFVFSVRFSRYRQANGRRFFAITPGYPAFYAMLSLTNFLHGLVRGADSRIVDTGPFPELTYAFTPVSIVAYLCAAALILASILFLFRYFLEGPREYRPQLYLVILGALVPIVGFTLSLAGGGIAGHRDALRRWADSWQS